MASEMDKLLENIESSRKELKAPGFDMNQYLLSDSDVVKNLLSIRNPNMTKGDINLMVDGLVDTGEQSSSIKEMESLSNDGDTDFKQKVISDKVEDSKNNLDKTGIPIPETDFIYEEVRDLKSMIVEKTFEFVRKIQELIQDMVFAGITISQSIPGAIQLITNPPVLVPAFNIPGMVTMLMNIILTLNSLKSKVDDVRGIFVNFSKLRVVCSEENANTVASILNGLNSKLNNEISSFTGEIDTFTGSASSSIKSSLDPSEEGKKVRTITKQLIRMKYLPNDNFILVDEDDKDGVNNILEEWEVIDRTNKTKAVKRKKESKDNLDNLVSSIEKLDNINDELKELTKVKKPSTGSTEMIVYDIEFPDGKIVKGLTKEEVDGYTKTYNIIYSPSVKFVEVTSPRKFSLKSAQRSSISLI